MSGVAAVHIRLQQTPFLQLPAAEPLLHKHTHMPCQREHGKLAAHHLSAQGYAIGSYLYLGIVFSLPMVRAC